MSEEIRLVAESGAEMRRGVVSVKKGNQSKRLVSFINFKEHGNAVTAVYYESKAQFDKINAAVIESLIQKYGKPTLGIIRTFIFKAEF